MGKPKQITKKDLVLSLKKELLKKGQGKVTLKTIAEAVGATQGVVYYHFKTKDQLVMALLEEFMESRKVNHVQQEASTKKVIQHVHSYLTEESYLAQTSAEDHQLLFEVVAISLHHRMLKHKMGQVVQEKVKDLTALAGGDEQVGRFLAALTDGLALHNMLDPSFSEDEVYGFAKEVLDMIIKKQPHTGQPNGKEE
jgi:AcrR family transcriptional regulator